MAPPVQPLPDSRVHHRVPLSRFTTFRIGGPADWFVTVESTDELVAALHWASQRDLETHFLGGGSNVIVADAGARGLTIVIRSSSLQQLQETRCVMSRMGSEREMRLDIPASTPLARLARWTVDQGLAGIEWAVGIPGTVGGAIVGNSGAHGGCIADSLHSVRLLQSDYTISILGVEEMGMHYRGSRIKTMLARSDCKSIIVEASLKLRIAKRADLLRQSASFLTRRRATQPKGWSAGSVFANPPGLSAGRLLDLAGLKGHERGAAQVSAKHANFIINRGGAKASDVTSLMAVCRQRVFDQFGVDLMPEIVQLGDWSGDQVPWSYSTPIQSGGLGS